jgi:hypothetical protein
MHTKFWSENLKGTRRRRWEDNIEMDLRVQGGDQWRALLNTVMNLWVP